MSIRIGQVSGTLPIPGVETRCEVHDPTIWDPSDVADVVTVLASDAGVELVALPCVLTPAMALDLARLLIRASDEAATIAFRVARER